MKTHAPQQASFSSLVGKSNGFLPILDGLVPPAEGLTSTAPSTTSGMTPPISR